jgi:hypothetical protein
MILQNPYRLLGVFANDPLRVRIANTAKIRAFSKIEKKFHLKQMQMGY